MSVVRKNKPDSKEWDTIIFKVFDAPLLKQVFKGRLLKLETELKGCASFIEILEQTPCKGIDHLEQEMDRVIAKKGEGIMLKGPKSRYENRRSDQLLKVKRF